MLQSMRRTAALVSPLCLVSMLLFGGCPGPVQDFSIPTADAEPNPPDAAIDIPTGPPVPVKILTWNVHNFFNDKQDSPGTLEPEEIQTTSKYQAQLDAVAKVVVQLNPDIMMLEEVENQAVIDDLAQKIAEVDPKVGPFEYRFITEGNDPRGIDIAVLSELPLQVAPSHKNDYFKASTDPIEGFKFARDVLEAHAIINGRHVVLLGIHFKAQDGVPLSDTKRLAEAERTRAIVTDVQFSDPSSAVIVLGDFNDVPGSPTLNALTGTGMLSATEAIPAGERYSVSFSGNLQLFDDQLADPKAAALLDKTSAIILHGPDANAASDHDPVMATYLVN